MKHHIFGVHITHRTENVPSVQATFTKYGCNIRTRLGIHDADATSCSPSERAAWNQALRLATRRLGKADPMIVLSHVPPRGTGDVPTDAYHRGFEGYHWLMNRLEPTLWLHGHTPLAAADEWKHQVGPTTVINVTGAVVIDLLPPGPETLARRKRRMKQLKEERQTDGVAATAEAGER